MQVLLFLGDAVAAASHVESTAAHAVASATNAISAAADAVAAASHAESAAAHAVACGCVGEGVVVGHGGAWAGQIYMCGVPAVCLAGRAENFTEVRISPRVLPCYRP